MDVYRFQREIKMDNRLTRRTFLKAGLGAASAAAAAGLTLPRSAMAGKRRELCTLLDIRKCIGCEACIEACRDVNDYKFPVVEAPIPKMRPTNRVKIADWSSDEKQEVRSRLTPYNWLTLQYAEVEYKGVQHELYIPRRCMHCRNAPCSKLCPFGAAFTQPNGIVRFLPDICMGGAKCKKVCPWKIPERQSGVGMYLNLMPQYAGNGVMYKCDRCHERVAVGGAPACVEECPEEVQQIGPRKEILERAHAIAEEIGGFIYGEEENGGTNTLYVSPVPFDMVNRAIEKGPGKPHLSHVRHVMAETNSKAILLAFGPVAGLTAAVARFMHLSREDGKEGDA